jgi:lipoprotein-anchoring transpeptidase ErfK/SrfK
MKIVALLLLTGLGAGGWYFWNHQRAVAAAEVQEASLLAEIAPAKAPPAPPLPPAALQALAAADAAWAKAGPSPATSAAAPDLARMYSVALRALYNQPGTAAREEQLIAERLTPLGNALFFSKTPFSADPQFPTHVIAPGESPEAVARKNGISRELVNRFRGKDVNDSKTRVGDTFKVVRLVGQTDPVKRGFQIHIDKSQYTLDLFIAGMFARRYACSHGAAQSPTPTGTTFVTNRVWHPDWTHPVSHKVIRYGEPDHLLGPIWLPFDSKTLGKSGIGIHGYTGTDAKMGVMASNGCIRLENHAAEELYHTVCHPDRSPIAVEIVE